MLSTASELLVQGISPLASRKVTAGSGVQLLHCLRLEEGCCSSDQSAPSLHFTPPMSPAARREAMLLPQQGEERAHDKQVLPPLFTRCKAEALFLICNPVHQQCCRSYTAAVPRMAALLSAATSLPLRRVAHFCSSPGPWSSAGLGGSLPLLYLTSDATRTPFFSVVTSVAGTFSR